MTKIKPEKNESSQALDCRKTSLKKINGVWGEAPMQVCVRLWVLHRAKPLCERYQASLLGRRVRLYQPYG